MLFVGATEIVSGVQFNNKRSLGRNQIVCLQRERKVPRIHDGEIDREQVARTIGHNGNRLSRNIVRFAVFLNNIVGIDRYAKAIVAETVRLPGPLPDDRL